MKREEILEVVKNMMVINDAITACEKAHDYEEASRLEVALYEYATHKLPENVAKYLLEKF